MKTITVGILALLSIAAMGSSVKKFNSLVLSGNKYLTVVDENGRFDIIQDRFSSEVLTTDRKSSDVCVRKVKNTFCVFVGNKLFVSVTNDDAKLHNSVPEKLALKWAANLAKTIEDVKPLEK